MKSFNLGVLSTVVSTIIVAALIGLWNDYSYKSCNLTGCWEMKLTYENTAKNSFKGMNVNYDLILSQNDKFIIGHGEKCSDDDRSEIPREGKSKLTIEGGVTYKVFSNNDINIFYYEENPIGKIGTLKSSTVLNLKQIGKDKIIGTFRSTIANTQGSVILERKKPGAA